MSIGQLIRLLGHYKCVTSEWRSHANTMKKTTFLINLRAKRGGSLFEPLSTERSLHRGSRRSARYFRRVVVIFDVESWNLACSCSNIFVYKMVWIARTCACAEKSHRIEKKGHFIILIWYVYIIKWSYFFLFRHTRGHTCARSAHVMRGRQDLNGFSDLALNSWQFDTPTISQLLTPQNLQRFCKSTRVELEICKVPVFENSRFFGKGCVEPAK